MRWGAGLHSSWLRREVSVRMVAALRESARAVADCFGKIGRTERALPPPAFQCIDAEALIGRHCGGQNGGDARPLFCRRGISLNYCRTSDFRPVPQHEADVDLHLHDWRWYVGMDAIERAKTLHPESDSRTTICHIEIVNADDVSRFAELGEVRTRLVLLRHAPPIFGSGALQPNVSTAPIRHGGHAMVAITGELDRQRCAELFNQPIAVTRRAGN